MPKGQYIRKVKPPLDRFLSRVDKNGPIPEKCPERGPCWIWTGSKNNKGYGSIDKWMAYRWAYEYFREPVPPGMELHHACENKNCCNPWHCDAMTRAEHKRLHAAKRARPSHKTCKCRRCGWEWQTYKPTPPKCCAKCKSAHWETDRTNRIAGNRRRAVKPGPVADPRLVPFDSL